MHPQPAGRFWIAADTQLHNYLGFGTHSKSWIPDEIAKVAIRPPSLDLWSDVTLRSALEQMAPKQDDIAAPLFFLGDAANAACINEYWRFLTVMGETRPWFGLFGNHDLFYMGNYVFRPDGKGTEPGANLWRGACDGGTGLPSAIVDRLKALEAKLVAEDSSTGTYTEQGTLPRMIATALYLHHLHVRHVIGTDPLDPGTWNQEGNLWVFRPVAGPAASTDSVKNVRVVAAVGVRGSNSGSEPWRGWLVQDVQLLDGNHVVLTDTSNYGARPPSWLLERVKYTFFRKDEAKCRKYTSARSLPGACGEIQADQIDEIKKFMATWAANERFFLAGHHPWTTLRFESARRLQELIRRPGFVAYLSAHTHYPTSTVGGDSNEQWEVNVGSTTDWPMQYARIDYWLPNGHEPWADIAVAPIAIRRQAKSERCPLSDVKSELAYSSWREYFHKDGTGLRYLKRAATVYSTILDEIAKRNDPQVSQALANYSPCKGKRDCLRDFKHRLDNASKQADLRVALKSVVDLDHNVLQTSTWINDLERSCAIWASEAERKQRSFSHLLRSEWVEPERGFYPATSMRIHLDLLPKL